MTNYFLTLKSACARITKVATAEAQRHAGVHGAQAQALLFLHQLGSCKISELASHLDLGRPAATTLVARMEKAGLLRRQPDPQDARASLVELTGNGRDTVANVTRVIASLNHRLTDGYSDQELETISNFLINAARLEAE